jgi:hypothetical protein
MEHPGNMSEEAGPASERSNQSRTLDTADKGSDQEVCSMTPALVRELFTKPPQSQQHIVDTLGSGDLQHSTGLQNGQVDEKLVAAACLGRVDEPDKTPAASGKRLSAGLSLNLTPLSLSPISRGNSTPELREPRDLAQASAKWESSGSSFSASEEPRGMSDLQVSMFTPLKGGGKMQVETDFHIAKNSSERKGNMQFSNDQGESAVHLESQPIHVDCMQTAEVGVISGEILHCTVGASTASGPCGPQAAHPGNELSSPSSVTGVTPTAHGNRADIWRRIEQMRVHFDKVQLCMKQ